MIQHIHDIVDPAAPAGVERVLQRQPRDQRDLQPDHARQPAHVHAADPALHDHRDLSVVPLVAQDGARGDRDRGQHPLDAGSVLADRLQLQRARQHAGPARRRARDRRRRAHHAALGRGAAPRWRGAGVQGDGRASRGAAALARARRRRSACCRWRPATSSRCARSASAPPSASWSTSRSRSSSMPTLLSLVKPESAEAPHERYLIGPLRAVARFSLRPARSASSPRRPPIVSSRRWGLRGCASTRTTSASSAPTTRSASSARGHRQGACRHLQLPDHARRAAGVDEDAGRAAADGSARRRSCGSCRTFAR